MARTLVKILPVEEVDLTGGGLGGNLEKLQDALFVPVQPDKLTPSESDTTCNFTSSVTCEVAEDDATLEEHALPFFICTFKKKWDTCKQQTCFLTILRRSIVLCI